MPKDSDKLKKKRGRPKGSKNKPKKTKTEAPKGKEPQFETKLGETKPEKLKAEAKPKEPPKEEPKVEAKPEEPKKEDKPVVASPAPSFSDKYRENRVFRREMGEPEFWLGKEGLVPPTPSLTKDEEQDISRKVLIPTDQTPEYKPQHILSPEFGGTSNYERGIDDFKQELEQKLQRLQADPDSNPQQITKTQEDLKTLDYLYENYYSGMNVFRTAKGGRSKLRE